MVSFGAIWLVMTMVARLRQSSARGSSYTSKYTLGSSQWQISSRKPSQMPGDRLPKRSGSSSCDRILKRLVSASMISAFGEPCSTSHSKRSSSSPFHTDSNTASALV